MSETLTLRRGEPSDQQWLFELFRTTMRDYIDAVWGWDELLQREGFITSLPATAFRVLDVDGSASGAYFLRKQQPQLLLEMIMVEPDCQGRGYGQLLMDNVKMESRKLDQPIRLRVLRTNPARYFHQAMGFVEVGSDTHSVTMQWPAEADAT